MVVFDTSVFLLVLDPNAKAPLDPATHEPVKNAEQRIEFLIDRLRNENEKIIIPTPVISEIMVHAGPAGSKYLQFLNGHAVFRVANFDQKAAIEAALSIRDSIQRGGIRIDATDPKATRGKVKFDRQIVAIAKAEGAGAIYSDDDDVLTYANQAGLKAYRTADLDQPPEDPQGSMDLG